MFTRMCPSVALPYRKFYVCARHLFLYVGTKNYVCIK